MTKQLVNIQDVIARLEEQIKLLQAMQCDMVETDLEAQPFIPATQVSQITVANRGSGQRFSCHCTLRVGEPVPPTYNRRGHRISLPVYCLYMTPEHYVTPPITSLWLTSENRVWASFEGRCYPVRGEAITQDDPFEIQEAN